MSLPSWTSCAEVPSASFLEAPFGEGAALTEHRDFVLRPTLEIFEGKARQPLVTHRTQVGDRDGALRIEAGVVPPRRRTIELPQAHSVPAPRASAVPTTAPAGLLTSADRRRHGSRSDYEISCAASQPRSARLPIKLLSQRLPRTIARKSPWFLLSALIPRTGHEAGGRDDLSRGCPIRS